MRGLLAVCSPFARRLRAVCLTYARRLLDVCARLAPFVKTIFQTIEIYRKILYNGEKKMSIRKLFEEELSDLKTELVEMCRLTETMIETAI